MELSGITDVKRITNDTLWLWAKCCRDIGVDPRLVRPYFLPIDEAPDWFYPTDCQIGQAFWEEGHEPQVIVFLYNPYEGDEHLTAAKQLSTILYHELIHILLYTTSEDEVRWLTASISRSRKGWQHYRSYLKAKAFEQSLGPVQESWTLFQWAKAQRRRRH